MSPFKLRSFTNSRWRSLRTYFFTDWFEILFDQKWRNQSERDFKITKITQITKLSDHTNYIIAITRMDRKYKYAQIYIFKIEKYRDYIVSREIYLTCEKKCIVIPREWHSFIFEVIKAQTLDRQYIFRKKSNYETMHSCKIFCDT